MLLALHIRNLALIEHAELRLGRGLNVISGQTGGGKSLVVTALELLRGERANGALVRRGAEELQVDGEFRLGEGERSRAVAMLVQDLCGGTVDSLAVSHVHRKYVQRRPWVARGHGLEDIGAACRDGQPCASSEQCGHERFADARAGTGQPDGLPVHRHGTLPGDV